MITPNICVHVSRLQTVVVYSLMTIDTQSTDQSVAQQLTTTTTHRLLLLPLFIKVTRLLLSVCAQLEYLVDAIPKRIGTAKNIE